MIEKLFTTKRLFIRRLSKDDIMHFHDMQGNPNVMRFIKKTMTFVESKKELDRFIEYYNNDKIYFKIWGVVQRNNNELAGLCGVYQNDKLEYEIAYRLRESYWGNGLGKEIAKGLIKYCFEKNNLDELIGYVIKGNIRSTKILKDQMNFAEEFFCKKTQSVELKFKLTKKQWEISD